MKYNQNQEPNMLKVTKLGIRIYANTVVLIRQTNFEILSFRRGKIMRKLNYRYRNMFFDQGDHPKFFGGIIFQSKP